jgi:hypothetical protein
MSRLRTARGTRPLRSSSGGTNYDDGVVDRSCPDKGLSAREAYFYDQEAVKEPATWGQPNSPASIKSPHGQGYTRRSNSFNRGGVRIDQGEGSDGQYVATESSRRNLRSVWSISTTPYPEAHYAVMPAELARRCIAAGTSERGCCPECGAPWRRVVERRRLLNGETPVSGTFARPDEPFRIPPNGVGHWRYTTRTTECGWEPSCRCEAGEPVPCTVLDPFAGSGTSLAVARRMGRKAVGVELQETYLPLIQARVAEAAQPLLEPKEEGTEQPVAEMLPLFDLEDPA